MARKPEYDAKFVVNFYAHFVEGLMKGEQMIIDTMGDQLPDWKMLDIGIGAGRTTRHFAPRVKEYLGVDYVPGMIEVVKRKFPSPEPHVRFEVADAQSMPQISDQYYDFCLFSFNGLDCNPYDERMKGLKEIYRILKPGGYFLFSTHNLQAIDVIFEIEKTKNPVRLGYSLFKYLFLHLILGNVNKLKKKDRIYIRDAAHLFRVKHMYHAPAEAVKQLKEVGFSEIRMFNYPESDEITDQDPATVTDSAFIFLLARK